MSCLIIYLKPAFGDNPINKLCTAYSVDQIEAMYAASASGSKDLHGYNDEFFEYDLQKKYFLANPLPKKKNPIIPKMTQKSHGFIDWRQAPNLWTWINEQDFNEIIKLALKLQLVTVHRFSVSACMRCEHLELGKEESRCLKDQ